MVDIWRLDKSYVQCTEEWSVWRKRGRYQGCGLVSNNTHRVTSDIMFDPVPDKFLPTYQNCSLVQKSLLFTKESWTCFDIYYLLLSHCGGLFWECETEPVLNRSRSSTCFQPPNITYQFGHIFIKSFFSLLGKCTHITLKRLWVWVKSSRAYEFLGAALVGEKRKNSFGSLFGTPVFLYFIYLCSLFKLILYFAWLCQTC